MQLFLLFFLYSAQRHARHAEIALFDGENGPALESLPKTATVLLRPPFKLGMEPTRFLSTIQAGITSIGILNGIIGEGVLAGPLRPCGFLPSAWTRSSAVLRPQPLP